MRVVVYNYTSCPEQWLAQNNSVTEERHYRVIFTVNRQVDSLLTKYSNLEQLLCSDSLIFNIYHNIIKKKLIK